MSTDVSLPRNDSSPSADVPVLVAATNPAEPKLPDDPVVLKRMIEELLTALRDKDRELEQVRHRLDQLLRRLYGPKTEKWDSNQLLLFPEILAALRGEQPPEEQPAEQQPTSEAEATVEPPRRRGHGRRRLPRELPRERREYALSEAERCCPDCGNPREKFHEEVTEQLDLVPAKLFVIEHARFKYKCGHCQGKIVTAPKPDGPIWRGLPGPGLSAWLIVSKYHDHLPLYRQESMFERYGVRISRQTQCAWAARFAEVLQPIVKLMKQDVLRSTVIHTDDTRVLVQDERRGKHIGSLWLYAGDRDHPGMVFDYTPTRSSAGPKEFLGNFAGFLQADAFTGYDAFFVDRNGRMTEVACNAHARRRFYEARTSSAAGSAAALAFYAQLYAVERQARKEIEELGVDGVEADAIRLRLRQAQSKPIMTAFRQWLDEQRTTELPKSPLGEAIAYALNNWTALTCYLDHGILDIDNNLAEQAMKHIATGRKNWLFFGSDEGGETAATLFSITRTCKRHGVDPWRYLRDALEWLGRHPKATDAELEPWLPYRWTAPATSPPPPALSPPALSPPDTT